METRSLSTDMANKISKSDKLVPKMFLDAIPEDAKVVNEEEKADIAVYSNGVTSIDVMLPEEEREILEKNVNVYSDLSKTNKLLNVARSNMKTRQGIKELEQIEKLGEMIDNGSLKLAEMFKDIDMVSYKTLQKSDPEAASKAIKNVAIALNSMMQARDNKLKSLSGGTSSKKVKIAVKFQNDSGSETAIGMEVGG